MGQENFSWDNLGNSVGNWITDSFDYLGGNLQANADQGSAIAALTAAQAAAIKQNQENRRQAIKYAFWLVALAIVAVVLVKLGGKFIK